MLKRVHADILRQALNGTFSARALAVIIAANLAQDQLRYQFGHPEFHCDDNSFEATRAYVAAQRAQIRPALYRGDAAAAWAAFARLTHSAQDFYAHSNYVDLWLACQSGGIVPGPSEINALDEDLIDQHALRSGKLYYPLEVLTFVGPLKKFIVPLLPRDSHAWMNLDSAERGPLFEYAFQAAVKRTKYEFELTRRDLSPALRLVFTDLGGRPDAA